MGSFGVGLLLLMVVLVVLAFAGGPRENRRHLESQRVFVVLAEVMTAFLTAHRTIRN